MTETVTIELDKYLEYKKYYELYKNKDYNDELWKSMYENKLQDMLHQLECAQIALRDQRRDCDIKLENYNKIKHGTFSDKLNFLFSKEQI